MTYRAAVALPAVFAAIGVVAGALRSDGLPAPATTVALIAVHGMLDNTVVYDRSAPSSTRAWAARNGCRLTPVADTLATLDAVRTTYGACRASRQVVLYSMRHGGHGWPTAGTSEAPVATTDTLWRFFAHYRANDTLVAADRRP